MNNTQTVIARLLSELKAICEENGIKYALHGSTAAKAIIMNESNLPYAQICISAVDFKKFISAVEASMPDGRRLDHMGNNRNFKGFGARYTDTNTTCIALNQNSNFYFCGMFVEIVVLRQHIPGRLERTRLNLLEHGWEGQFRYFGILGGKKYMLAALYVSILKLFLLGRKNTAEFIFKKLLAAYGKNYGTGHYIKSYNRRIVNFDRDPLSGRRTAMLFDEEHPLPLKYDAYIKMTYSVNWRKRAEEPVNNIGRLISSSVPYAEMVRRLEEEGFSLKKYAKLYDRKNRHHSRHLKYDKIKNEAWDTAKRSGDRLELSEYYEPKMELIRKLYAEGNYYPLSKLMKKHRRTMVRHLEKGKGFAVNRELFEIQMTLFEIEGKSDVVAKLRRITPAEYMKPIV